MRSIDPTPPSPLPPRERISLEALTAERVELYNHVLPPGRTISIEVSPFPLTIISRERRKFSRR